EAVRPVQGLLHTLQAIPENLVFGNLGLAVQTTGAQGAVLTLGLVALWLSRLGPWRHASGKNADRTGKPGATRAESGAISPLECTGAALVVGSYLIEWSFRGSMDHRDLRTINMRFVVPWYDVIPQIGTVLLLAGWWSGFRPAATQPRPATKPKSLTTWES